MSEEEEPPSSRAQDVPAQPLTDDSQAVDDTAPALNGTADDVSVTPPPQNGSIISWLKSLLGNRQDTNLREALEEYIEEHQETEKQRTDLSVSGDERNIISNVLKMHDMTVKDIMIPRADIAAIECRSTQEQIFALLAERQYSRFPVYHETLDEILGTIHIKDIISCMARGEKISVKKLVRDVPIISPSMRVTDLLVQMRESRKHMALVVDEFGGIDGLATVGDIIEAIIGDIDDEHDPEEGLEMSLRPDGSVIADARVYLEEFEEHFGMTLQEEDKEDNDTLGGLVFSIAGRVPTRGEILTHDNGMVFEVLEADARRVGRVRISNIPGLTKV